MFEVILKDSLEKKEDNLKLSGNLTETPLEKSIAIDNILDRINLDIVHILKYNRI